MAFSVLETSLSALKANPQLIDAPAVLDEAQTRRLTTQRFTGSTKALHYWCRSTEGVRLRRRLPNYQVYLGFEQFSHGHSSNSRQASD